MSKIKLKACLKTAEETTYFEGMGLLKNNKLQYLDEALHVTILMQENTITLKRMHETYQIELPLKLNTATVGSYELILEGLTLPLSIKTLTLEIEKSHIHVIYELLDQIYEYELNYEVIE